jgi:hypothetical protein
MAISDKDLRELAQAMQEVIESNKKALDRVSDGLSQIAEGMKDESLKSDKSGNNAKNAKTDDDGQGIRLQFSKENIEQLGESIGRHIARNGGMSGEGGGEGGGGEPAGGRSAAEAAQQAKNVSNITGLQEDLIKQLAKFGDNLQEDIQQYTIRQMQSVVRQITTAMSEFFSGQDAIRGFTDRFELALDSTSRNLGSFVDALHHDFTLVRMSFRETMRSITDDLSSGGRAFAIFGGTMEEYSEELRSLRQNINQGDVDMFRTMALAEQNDYLNKMYQTMVSQGITERLNSEEVRNYARNQYIALTDIQNLTGLSLKELQEMNSANQVVIDELVARGRFTEEQGAELTAATTAITAVMPEELRGLFNQGLQQGIAPAQIAFMDNNAATMANLGNAIDAMEAAISNGMTADEARGIFMSTIDWDALNNIPLTAIDGQMQSMLNSFRASYDEREAQRNGFLSEMSRRFDALFAEFPVLGVIRDVGSGIFGVFNSIAALNAAIIANTTAVTANTASQLGGLFGGRGLFRGLFRATGISGAMSGIMSAARGLGKILPGLLRFGTVVAGAISIITDGIDLFRNFGNMDWTEVGGSILTMIGKGLLIAGAVLVGGIPGAVIAAIGAAFFGLDALLGGRLTDWVEDGFTWLLRQAGNIGVMLWNGFKAYMSFVTAPYRFLFTKIGEFFTWLWESSPIRWIRQRLGLMNDTAAAETQSATDQINRETRQIVQRTGELRTAEARRSEAALDREAVEASLSPRDDTRERDEDRRERARQTRLLEEIASASRGTRENTRPSTVYNTEAVAY